MTVAITGGTGFVGHTLVERAQRKGVRLSALTRSEQNPRGDVEWIRGDLGNREALLRLVRGAEAVIHVAGVVNAPDAEGFEEGNVAGTMNVVQAALAEGVRRFLFVSSLAAREADLSAYGASKARAEKIVQSSGLDWTIVRPPAIFGPHDREMFELFRAAKWGIMPMPPEGRVSLIHVSDLAELLLDLVRGGEDVTHRLFEVDDGRAEGWTHGELARAIGTAMHKRVWAPHLSRNSLDMLSKIDRFLRRDRAKLTADRVSYMCHPDWVANPSCKVPAARWRPKVDTPAGLLSTAQWYRDRGWL